MAGGQSISHKNENEYCLLSLPLENEGLKVTGFFSLILQLACPFFSQGIEWIRGLLFRCSY